MWSVVQNGLSWYNSWAFGNSKLSKSAIGKAGPTPKILPLTLVDHTLHTYLQQKDHSWQKLLFLQCHHAWSCVPLRYFHLLTITKKESITGWVIVLPSTISIVWSMVGIATFVKQQNILNSDDNYFSSKLFHTQTRNTLHKGAHNRQKKISC